MDAMLLALATGSEPDAEKRWLVGAAQALAVLQGAGTSLESTIEGGVRDGASRDGAWIRTTYFDTPRFTLAGKPGGVRARIRLREYADASGSGAHPHAAALELKLSTGDVRLKERLTLGLTEARMARAGELAWLSITATADAPALAAWLGRLGGELRPVAMTWYRRHAFRTSDGHVRVTLDDGVRLCRPAAAGAPLTPTTDLVCAAFTSHVLEVKGCGPLPTALEGALAALGAPADFSKYETALSAIRRADAPRVRTLGGGTAARLAAARAPR